MRNQFFLFPEDHEPRAGDRGVAVKFENLKAVFFVKDFVGHPEGHTALQPPQVTGKKLEITFADSEKLVGTTVAYNPKSLGFFVQPLDRADNNERVFIINQNVRQVRVV